MNEDDTRTRILHVAGTAFANHGFEGTTIRTICELAHVNVASVNYHFGDKEQLYKETMRFAHRFRADQTPLPEWPPTTPAKQKLRDFIHTTIKRLLVAKELPWQAQLMMREMLNPTDACRELAQDCFRPHFEMLLGILDELLPASVPLPKRHQLAFSVIGQCLFYKFNDKVIRMLIPEAEVAEHFQPPMLADFITDVMLASLAKKALF